MAKKDFIRGRLAGKMAAEMTRLDKSDFSLKQMKEGKTVLQGNKSRIKRKWRLMRKDKFENNHYRKNTEKKTKEKYGNSSHIFSKA